MSKVSDKAGTQAGLPIAAVQRDTGLGKDTLRVWEKRYGFPMPSRDSTGNRVYPSDQVERLKLISRLLSAGQRPGKVVGLDLRGLQAELSRLTPVLDKTPVVDLGSGQRMVSSNGQDQVEREAKTYADWQQECMDAIGAHQPQTLHHLLSMAQSRMGLSAFVIELVAPLTTAVGEAWMRGQFEVFEEHLFTEVLKRVLRQAIGLLMPLSDSGGPRILLTTLPDEKHGLGLLMVEAILALEGCTCISLGTQTPILDIGKAVKAHRADIVALSFTNMHSGAVVLTSLAELRNLLPKTTQIWAGGSCSALYQQPLAGITAVKPLSGLPPLVHDWKRARH